MLHILFNKIINNPSIIGRVILYGDRMGIQEQENLLFSKWKKIMNLDKDKFFVEDGIVDEESWNNAPLKILYLLKEANGAEEEWDERVYLKNYTADNITKSQTIDAIIKWQFGLVDTIVSDWIEVQYKTSIKETQQKLLSQICLVNIKKIAGKASVDIDEFNKYFSNQNNIEFLRQQLSFYKPDIVISCGVSGWLCKIYNWKNNWNCTNRGIKYCIHDDIIYLDFWHPNNRGVSRNVLYYTLVDAIKDILYK